MDKSRYDLVNKKYGEFLDKISLLKKKKLEIVAKFRKKVDEKKLNELRGGGREVNL